MVIRGELAAVAYFKLLSLYLLAAVEAKRYDADRSGSVVLYGKAVCHLWPVYTSLSRSNNYLTTLADKSRMTAGIDSFPY